MREMMEAKGKKNMPMRHVTHKFMVTQHSDGSHMVHHLGNGGDPVHFAPGEHMAMAEHIMGKHGAADSGNEIEGPDQEA